MNEKSIPDPPSPAGGSRPAYGVPSREMKLRWMDCGGIGLFTFIEVAGIVMLVVIVFQLLRLMWR